MSDGRSSSQSSSFASDKNGSALITDPRFVDPSTADGSTCIFDREVSLEVRRSEDKDDTIGSIMSIKVKLLVLSSDVSPEVPESVRVELSMEDDLFFAMYHQLQEKGFEILQSRQKLMLAFRDYAGMLIKNFTKCIKDPHNCMGILYINNDGSGRIDFIQNMEFKFVELLSIDFLQTPPDILKQHIVFRYFALKHSVQLLQNRLTDVSDIVRQKSPSLLLQIKRAPLRQFTKSPNSNSSIASSSSSSSSVAKFSPKSPSNKSSSSPHDRTLNHTHTHMHGPPLFRPSRRLANNADDTQIAPTS